MNEIISDLLTWLSEENLIPEHLKSVLKMPQLVIPMIEGKIRLYKDREEELVLELAVQFGFKDQLRKSQLEKLLCFLIKVNL